MLFVVKVFQELHGLCLGNIVVQEMLLDLLSVEDAMTLGQVVYDQFRMRNEQKKFFRKLRKYYDKQQSAHTRILKEISLMLQNEEFNQKTLTTLANKLFKGNHHLYDSFLALFPIVSCS